MDIGYPTSKDMHGSDLYRFGDFATSFYRGVPLRWWKNVQLGSAIIHELLQFTTG